jgi:hypothetical protein
MQQCLPYNNNGTNGPVFAASSSRRVQDALLYVVLGEAVGECGLGVLLVMNT